MPKDYKKMYLDIQSQVLKQQLENEKLKNEIENLQKIQQLSQQLSEQQNTQNPQQVTQFESDVKYIVGLAQRMSLLLRECRTKMLPMELGKRIDSVLREIERF